MYIDSHAHLTDDTLYPDIENILQRAKQAGVEQIINICTDLKTLKRGLELSKKYSWIFNTGSTTPHDVTKEGEAYFAHFEKAALDGHLIAIGETGLDYYYEHSPKELQQFFLKRYLRLAKRSKLPVVIHCRDAFEDFFSILDSEYTYGPGVLHCFTGTPEEAKELVERGWMVSFSGIVTFKKSNQLRLAALEVPIEQLLIETDAPYLAPQSKRGKQNEPAFVVETAQKIAEIKGLSLEQVAEITSSNTCKFFQIP